MLTNLQFDEKTFSLSFVNSKLTISNYSIKARKFRLPNFEVKQNFEMTETKMTDKIKYLYACYTKYK